MKILMVCLGNICRSPLAEGVMKKMIDEAGLDWEVDSAGTLGHQIGCQPHQLSQKLARIHGFDISYQACRKLTEKDLEIFDKIYVMDSENYADVISLAKKSGTENKVDFLLNELHPGRNFNIPDPWYGGEDGYHQVYEMIENACRAIVKKYGGGKTAKSKSKQFSK
jgi:protein-tyrosine phosphatase